LQGYGFGQDEDQGQLGAWYEMAAIGLFDVQGHTGATPTFQFGSPMFEKVTIQLSDTPNNQLIIETKNNKPENLYIQRLMFNNEPIEDCWIERKKLIQGGKLVIEMESVPNKKWGVNTPPPSMHRN
jgi:putative alpha-1,2-mannosidase